MLLQFSRTGQLPLGKIGQRLQVHPASVTNVIDRLEGKGFVERRPHPDDQRTTLATITRSGRAAASRATVALNDQVFTQTGLSDRSLRSLVDVVTDLRRATGDFDESTERSRLTRHVQRVCRFRSYAHHQDGGGRRTRTARTVPLTTSCR